MDSWDDRAPSWVGAAMVFGAAALFSVNGTVSKLVLADGGLSSLRLVEIRCLGAAVVLAAIALARNPAAARISLRELGFLAVYAVVGLAMVQWLYFVAIARMPVSISLLIEFSAPLMVALWVRFVRGEAVRNRVWAALALTLAGLALVAQVWDGLTLDGIGLLAAWLAAASLAAYYLLGERGLGSRDPVSLAAWSFILAAVFWALVQPWWTFPFDALTAPVDLDAATGGRLGLDVPTWLLVVWIVLLGSVAPFLLVLGGLSRVGATRTGLIGTAEPALAGLVAWVALGEVLSAVQLLGGAVVLAGIVLAETSRAPHPTPAGAVPEGMTPA